MSETAALSPIIRAIAWRVNLAVWLNRTLGRCGAVLAAVAMALVACKMLWPGAAPYAPALAALLPLAMLRGYMECRRRRLFFTPAEIVEVIDHLYRDDGSVSAAWENAALLPGATLEEAQRAVADRLPRLDLKFYLKKTIPVLALLAVALAVPSRAITPLPQSEAILATLTQPLAEKLAENQQILPEEALKELKDEVAALQKDEQGISKEKWEAVEELQQRIDGSVEQSRQNVAATANSLSKLSDLMDASGNIAGKSAEAQAQDILKDLEKSMKDAKTPLPAGMRKEIGEMASQMRQGGAASQEMRQKLESLKKELGNCPGGNCDGPGQVGRSGNGKGGDGQNGDGQNGDGQNGPDGDGNPGQGGVTRGRGDAQLTLGDEKKAQGAQYKDQEVQNQFITPQDLVDMGITPLPPKPDPGKFSPGTVRQFQAQEGSGVSRTRISPSQKDVIAKYFSEK